jgi:hypothetical protein
MGCVSSKKDVVEDPVASDKTAEANTKNAAAAETKGESEAAAAPEAAVAVAGTDEGEPDGKPKPQIFAIMRNGHEVIRGAQKDVEALIEVGEIEQAKELWVKMHKWCDIHMKMEEGSGSSDKSPIGMFK